MNTIIDVKIEKAVVSINGKEYAVAERAVPLERKLMDIQTKEKNGGYVFAFEIWADTIEILLGEEAKNELFPDMETANVDFMERVFHGVLEAYKKPSETYKESTTKQKATAATSEIRKMVQEISPLMDAAGKMEGMNREQRRAVQFG